MDDNNAKCKVPEGTPLGTLVDIYLSSDVIDNEDLFDTSSNFDTTARNSNSALSKNFVLVARNRFEIGEPLKCILDVENYTENVRHGYIRILGNGFLPHRGQSSKLQIQCVFRDA